MKIVSVKLSEILKDPKMGAKYWVNKKTKSKKNKPKQKK